MTGSAPARFQAAVPHKRSAMLAPLLLVLLEVGCGGFVYRPDPEPPKEFPVDTAVEQEIYRTAAKRPGQNTPPAPPPAHEPSVKAPPGPPQDILCVNPDGTAFSFVAAIGRAPESFYSVHLFSFRRYDLAVNAGRDMARRSGRMAYVCRTELPGSGIWHRVYVGNFSTKTAAQAFGGTLKAQGIQT